MTATNHAVTGALIAFVVGNPAIALPAAFLSHFVCDAIPHFDPRMPSEMWIKTKAFRRLITADASLCLLFVIFLALDHPHHWLLASICAFLATSPDLFWINRFVRTRRGKAWKPNWFSIFAARIQWFTFPGGAIIELVWFGCIVALLMPFLR